jgi:hypothetical protein
MSIFYVTTTDSFMSGWGQARNMINKLIFICESMEQAQIVADNASNRGDQKRVNICSKAPAYYRKTMGSDYVCKNYYVQIKTIDDYPTWYQKGAFK